MSKYFTISHGLRGGYCDNSVYVVRCDTRKELKATIASEADSYRDAGYIGANKRAIAWLANAVWKEAHKPNPAYLPHCLPLAPPWGRDNYCSGVFASAATRGEYVEYCQQEEC